MTIIKYFVAAVGQNPNRARDRNRKDNMAKLKDFLTALATKSGIDLKDANNKSFFDSAIPDFDIPDAVENEFANKLISVTDAMNNHPDIKNHYSRQALKSIDAAIERIMDDSGYDDSIKSEINNERSSYRRMELLIDKIKDLESKKHGGASGNKEIQKQIDELNAQLRAEKENTKRSNDAHQKELLKFRSDAAVDALLARIDTIYDDPGMKIPPEVRSKTLHALIENEMLQKKLKFLFDENGMFTIQKDDGTNFYAENNQQVFPKQFIEKALAQSNVLKVTNNAPGSTNVPGNTINAPVVPGKTQKSNATFAALAQETLNDIKKSSVAMPNGM